MDLITSLTSQVVNKALDGLSKRHTAIASNLANVETPNYRRRDVQFEGSLAAAMEKAQGKASLQASNKQPLAMRSTRPEHFALGQTVSVSEVPMAITESEGVQSRNDGNAVDLEFEMAQLAKNTQRYMALSNIESRRLRGLRSVITNSGG